MNHPPRTIHLPAAVLLSGLLAACASPSPRGSGATGAPGATEVAGTASVDWRDRVPPMASRPGGVDGYGLGAGLTPRRDATVSLFPGEPYEETRVRLQVFAESIELSELEHDFELRPTQTSVDIERDRFGFRAEFGGDPVGGFFQVFVEEYTDPLLPAVFDNVGLGGGIIGTPKVANIGEVDLLVPFRVEIDVAVGIEEVGGFDEEFVYFESVLEVGFGARWRGLQPSAGLMVHSLVGLHESDDPTDPSHLEPTTITGTNAAGFFQLLYKHDAVPFFARFRTVFGDVQGVFFAVGAAF